MPDNSTKWESIKSEIGRDYDLSIIIPAYNEAARILPTLNDITEYFATQKIRYEVLVVDDGSRDETAKIIKDYGLTHPAVRLLQQPRNMGKGAAVKAGMLASRGQFALFTDADGSTPICEVERLFAAARDGVKVIIGSRALYSHDTAVKTVWYRKLLGRCFNLCVNIFILPGIKDTQCGFKMFAARAAHTVFNRQTANRFSFDLEILYLTRLFKFSFREVAINWHNVPGSKVNLVVDSAKMLLDIFRFRWIHRHTKPDPQ